MSVAATAKALGVGWKLVNQVGVDVCHQLVFAAPSHLAGVRILGVDEHAWKHVRKPGEPSNRVTILVYLAPWSGAVVRPPAGHAPRAQRWSPTHLAQRSHS